MDAIFPENQAFLKLKWGLVLSHSGKMEWRIESIRERLISVLLAEQKNDFFFHDK